MYVCICMYICMYGCMYVCMYVCMSVYIYICVCVSEYIWTNAIKIYLFKATNVMIENMGNFFTDFVLLTCI